MKLNVRVKALAGAMVLAGTMAGCSKEVNCEIKENHMHMYKNDRGYVTYYDSEYENLHGFKRYDDYVYGSTDKKDQFAFEKELVKIDDNIDLIKEHQSSDGDYTLYQYYWWTGKFYEYSWTEDKNHFSLTGNEKHLHHMYQACDIEKNIDGDFVLVYSDLVDDLNLVKDEYPYITSNYVVVIDKDTNERYEREDGSIHEHLGQEKELSKVYQK